MVAKHVWPTSFARCGAIHLSPADVAGIKGDAGVTFAEGGLDRLNARLDLALPFEATRKTEAGKNDVDDYLGQIEASAKSLGREIKRLLSASSGPEFYAKCALQVAAVPDDGLRAEIRKNYRQATGGDTADLEVEPSRPSINLRELSVSAELLAQRVAMQRNLGKFGKTPGSNPRDFQRRIINCLADEYFSATGKKPGRPGRSGKENRREFDGPFLRFADAVFQVIENKGGPKAPENGPLAQMIREELQSRSCSPP